MKSSKSSNKKPNGQKKPKGSVNIRQATSSLNAYRPKNSDGPVRSVPAAMGSMKVVGRPRINQVGALGDSRIIHREYLAEVTMQTSFQTASFPMNPGASRTFPWLSTIAARYESYRFRRLRFCYETSCSSTQVGTVLLVPDYDAHDSAPVSKTQALAYRNSARGQPWLSFCQESAREDLEKLKSKYVRVGGIPAGADILLYDVGTMFLCVSGSDTNVVGELWVEYDVELMTPNVSGDVISQFATAGGVFDKTAIFGNAPAFRGTLDATIAGNTIQFNAAYEGLVNLWLIGTTLIAPVVTGTATRLTAGNGLGAFINAAATQELFVLDVRAQPGQTVIFDATGSATVTGSNLRIGQYTFNNA